MHRPVRYPQLVHVRPSAISPTSPIPWQKSKSYDTKQNSWTPDEVSNDQHTPPATPEKKSCPQGLWFVLLVIIILLLVAAVVILSILLFLRSAGNNSQSSADTTAAAGATVASASIVTTITTQTTTTSTASTTTSATTTTTTAGTTVCSSTAITTTVTSAPLPAECSNHTVITDNSRNAGVSVANYTCDGAGPITSVGAWFRFSGGAGTMLASCVVPIYRCSTHAPGWYSGVHPSAAGGTINGTVCYHWSSNTCNWSNWVLVTNCNGYYVYFLRSPPSCTLRYCTI